MARNWQYPRWRRLLMQSAMWGILGATVALAALVDQRRHALTLIALGPEVECDVIHLRLPANWNVQTDAVRPGLLAATSSLNGNSRQRLFITAAPPAGNGLLDRMLKLDAPPTSRQSPDTPIQGHLLRTLRMTDRDVRSEAISFGTKGMNGGATIGQLYVRENLVENDEGHEVPVRRQTVATVALPDGPQVTLRLEHIVLGADPLDDEEEDVDLVQRIAATVRQIAPMPSPDGGDQQ